MMGFAERRIDWGNVAYWLGFGLGTGTLILWIIAKFLGFIHSPLWLEMLPLMGVAVTLITFGIKFGEWKNKSEFAYHKSLEVDKRQDRMAQGLIRLEYKTDLMSDKLDTLIGELRDHRKEYVMHLKKHHA